MGPLALVACVLAVAGCRQLFGIDDTAVGTDAPAGPGADAAAGDAAGITGICADPHLFCADFDGARTGLALFEQQISSVDGFLGEQDSGSAVSAPRVLSASVAAGLGPAHARGVGRFPQKTRAVARVWVSAPLLGLGCTPYVLSLYDPAASAGAAVILAADGYHIVAFDSSGTVSDTAFGMVAAAMHELSLEILIQAPVALVTLTASGLALQVEVAELASPGLRLAEVAAGVVVVADHGLCAVYFDNLVVDEVGAVAL